MPGEHRHLLPSLQELQDFIREANAGLSKPLEEGDYDGLVEVMGHLMRVKERQAETDSMFEPLKETVALLSTYGEEMPEEIHLQLQVSCTGCGGPGTGSLGPGCRHHAVLPAGAPRALGWHQEALPARQAERGSPASQRGQQHPQEVPAVRGACPGAWGRVSRFSAASGGPCCSPRLPAAPPEPRPPRAGPAARLPGEVPGKSPFFIH